MVELSHVSWKHSTEYRIDNSKRHLPHNHPTLSRGANVHLTLVVDPDKESADFETFSASITKASLSPVKHKVSEILILRACQLQSAICLVDIDGSSNSNTE